MSILSKVPLNPLSVVQKWITVAGAGLILVLSVSLYLSIGKIDKLNVEIGQAEVKLSAMEKSINDLTAQRDADIKALENLRSERSVLRNVMSKITEELEELKRNEQMVQADPAGFELIVNDRLERLFVDLSCASNPDRESCADPTTETGPVVDTEP